MHTLATAHEHTLENVIDQLLQDFLQVWGPDDYSTQFVDECLPIIFNIFRYSKVNTQNISHLKSRHDTIPFFLNRTKELLCC